MRAKEINKTPKCATLEMQRNLGRKEKDRREDRSRRGEDQPI